MGNDGDIPSGNQIMASWETPIALEVFFWDL